MLFVLAKNINDREMVVCDEQGKSTINISKEKYLTIINKICVFDNNKIAIYNSEGLIRNSLTVIGKYYSGKYRNLEYLVCDGNLLKKTLTKDDIVSAYRKGIPFSNIKVTADGSIRMLKGSMPFLNNLNNLRSNNTVIKIGNIKAGTPGSLGVGKKFLGSRLSDHKTGCVKFKLFGGSYDLNNEVLTYKLGKILNYDVAEATIEHFNGKTCAISIYNYNISTESISTLKTEVGTYRFHSRFNEKWMKCNKSAEAWDKFIQMVMLDLIMHQTDRHLSNIAFKKNTLYSLYDNGRAMFYDDFYNNIKKIDLNNRGSIVDSFFTNEHGYGWIYLEDVLGYENYKHLIRHDLRFEDFNKIVSESYGEEDKFRNNWVSEYMFKVYLIITRQEKRCFK